MKGTPSANVASNEEANGNRYCIRVHHSTGRIWNRGNNQDISF